MGDRGPLRALGRAGREQLEVLVQSRLRALAAEALADLLAGLPGAGHPVEVVDQLLAEQPLLDEGRGRLAGSEEAHHVAVLVTRDRELLAQLAERRRRLELLEQSEAAVGPGDRVSRRHL